MDSSELGLIEKSEYHCYLPLSGAAISADYPNLGPLYQNSRTIFTADIMDHQGSSKVFPWDRFKPYLSRFEPVVWILEI